MRFQVISEEDKEGGRQRLDRKYNATDTPQLVRDREDYLRFKLNELFKEVNTAEYDYITLDELFQFLIQKGSEVKKDPNYDLTGSQRESIRQFFGDIDEDGVGNVAIQEMVARLLKFHGINANKASRIESRLKDLEEEIASLDQKLTAAKDGKESFRKLLKIYVIEAQDLKSDRISADTCAQVYFGQQSSKTKVIYSTLSPVWNDYLNFFVDNENDTIKIAIWDQADSNLPLAKCSTSLPQDPEYNQTMVINWIPLTSVDGKGDYGKIRLGIQYISNKAKFLEMLIAKKNSELDNIDEDYNFTIKKLQETFEPFEILVKEAQMKPMDMEETNPALDKILNTIEKPVGLAEEYVSKQASILRPASMKWVQVLNIGAIAYAMLACLIAFHRQDVVNLAFSCLLCYVAFFTNKVSKSQVKKMWYLLIGSFLYDFICLLLFFSDYTSDIAADGGAETNLRRFVYFAMVLMTLVKIPVAVTTLMIANEMKESTTDLPDDMFGRNEEEFNVNALVRQGYDQQFLS